MWSGTCCITEGQERDRADRIGLRQGFAQSRMLTSEIGPCPVPICALAICFRDHDGARGTLFATLGRRPASEHPLRDTHGSLPCGITWLPNLKSQLSWHHIFRI